MIEWLEKIPDSMTGAFAAAAVWFGFNVAVLGPRAMERAQASQSLPSCMEALRRHQQRLVMPQLDLGRRLGVPELEMVERAISQLAAPRPLSAAEQAERCACAVRRAARAATLDYAIHTATFRLIEPEAVAGLGDRTVGAVFEGVCGVLPQVRQGR